MAFHTAAVCAWSRSNSRKTSCRVTAMVRRARKQRKHFLKRFKKKCNCVTGSPPKFDTLLASWYPTYMQSFIISHSSCAAQYGDTPADTQTRSLTNSHIHTLTHNQTTNGCCPTSWPYQYNKLYQLRCVAYGISKNTNRHDL